MWEGPRSRDLVGESWIMHPNGSIFFIIESSYQSTRASEGSMKKPGVVYQERGEYFFVRKPPEYWLDEVGD